VGANIGLYSLYFLQINEIGNAFCFEADNKNFEMLKVNLGINNFFNRAF
jgi:FkbM family methyltransferase